LLGEHGTGKELIARTIHQLSPRAQHPMITVNCATIPEALIESELFGHEKGAFAEATSKKRGHFELADKGTVFLDEIGDMSLRTQSKVLRFLEEQSFQRVGGARNLIVNVRIIAATNKNLEQAIAEGRFREDLYDRLNVIPIKVPALRERIEDLPLLVETFLEECALKSHAAKRKISTEALALLAQHPWPGNVRELKNLIERLVIMAEGDSIEESDLPEPYGLPAQLSEPALEARLFRLDSLEAARKAFERKFIQHKLALHANDVNRTAEDLGLRAADVKKILERPEK
jgi:two-component system nitrogen regulation response regulator NtrX